MNAMAGPLSLEAIIVLRCVCKCLFNCIVCGK